MDELKESLKIKNVILRGHRLYEKIPVGMDVITRREQNNENYMTVTGTKAQINEYLQDKPIMSERLRTLKNIPHFRIIKTTKKWIY